MHFKIRGFTFVEMVVVVAVIGVLAAIAIPQFMDYLKKSKRSDAVGVLTEAAQFMERYYSDNGGYYDAINNANPTLPAAISVVPRGATDVYYNISFSGTNTASAFTVQAVPVNSMAGDACGTFTLTNTGQRAVSGSKALAECWQQ